MSFAASEPLRLIIADSDPLARRVLRDRLQAAGFVVIAEATDGVEAEELAGHYAPELLITEYQLPRRDGIELIERLAERVPDVRSVLLTVDPTVGLALAVVRAGGWGILSKEIAGDSLVRALRGVHAGEPAIPRRVTAELIGELRRAARPARGVRPIRSTLSPREWEVLDELMTGATTQEIARTLVVSEDTVYTHIRNLSRKLGVQSREEAIAAARILLGLDEAA